MQYFLTSLVFTLFSALEWLQTSLILFKKCGHVASPRSLKNNSTSALLKFTIACISLSLFFYANDEMYLFQFGLCSELADLSL